MNRVELRQLADDRILDARVLLDAATADRWSGAYYLTGYAVECGLKACVMAYVERTGEIFRDKEFSKRCFTHNLYELIKLARLDDQLEIREKDRNSQFRDFWAVVKDWSEASRYQQKTEAQSRALFDAVTHDPDGVLPWIKTNW